jgi:aspartate--ammonia ligase
LHKAHIGEVQAGVWPQNIVDSCKKNNIFLL